MGRAERDSSRKPAVLVVVAVDVVDDGDVEEEEKEKKKKDDDDDDNSDDDDEHDDDVDGDDGEKETTRTADTLEYEWSCSSVPVIRDNPAVCSPMIVPFVPVSLFHSVCRSPSVRPACVFRVPPRHAPDSLLFLASAIDVTPCDRFNVFSDQNSSWTAIEH